jgi:predicted nuclease with TOPRIM domain
MAKKIKKDQLTKLQDLVKNYNQHQLKLGELEIEKHQVLHGASTLQAELQKYQEELRSIYGGITIDINDGSYKKLDDEPSTEN